MKTLFMKTLFMKLIHNPSISELFLFTMYITTNCHKPQNYDQCDFPTRKRIRSIDRMDHFSIVFRVIQRHRTTGRIKTLFQHRHIPNT